MPPNAERQIGKRIARMRAAREVTQAQLAQALAVSEQTVRNWESGKGSPRLSDVPALMKVLQCTSASLVGGIGEGEGVGRAGPWDGRAILPWGLVELLQGGAYVTVLELRDLLAVVDERETGQASQAWHWTPGTWMEQLLSIRRHKPTANST